MPLILCIEDDPNLREDLVEELTDAGYDLQQAQNGREGLDMIKRRQPDLVISDISMPEMNGYELLKEVRENMRHLAPMPFIFLSALASREEKIKGLDIGADDYLTKPVDFFLLVSRVQAILRMKQRMRMDIEEAKAPFAESFQTDYNCPTDLDDEIVWE